MYNTTTTLELGRAVNITGEGYRDRFGFALAVLDFNLDGVDDLVVSSGNTHTLFVAACRVPSWFVVTHVSILCFLLFTLLCPFCFLSVSFLCHFCCHTCDLFSP